MKLGETLIRAFVKLGETLIRAPIIENFSNFTNFLSTFINLFINFLSTFINILSTFYQLLSTFYQLYQLFINFINFLSTLTFYQLYQLFINFINFINFLSTFFFLATFYQLCISCMSTFYQLFISLEEMITFDICETLFELLPGHTMFLVLPAVAGPESDQVLTKKKAWQIRYPCTANLMDCMHFRN